MGFFPAPSMGRGITLNSMPMQQQAPLQQMQQQAPASTQQYRPLNPWAPQFGSMQNSNPLSGPAPGTPAAAPTTPRGQLSSPGVPAAPTPFIRPEDAPIPAPVMLWNNSRAVAQGYNPLVRNPGGITPLPEGETPQRPPIWSEVPEMPDRPPIWSEVPTYPGDPRVKPGGDPLKPFIPPIDTLKPFIPPGEPPPPPPVRPPVIPPGEPPPVRPINPGPITTPNPNPNPRWGGRGYNPREILYTGRGR